MADRNDDKTQNYVALPVGTMVSHYRIVDKIGAGGMGEVYLAEDTKLDRRVALKFLPANLANNADMRSRFTREAQAAAKLDHPNIVTIHEVGEYSGRPFFAMQFIDGRALDVYCGDESLPIARIMQLVAQVAEGLGKAHSVGIIHRDIKSSNIMVDGDACPRILDFGLATVQGGEALTRTGSTLGTISYMSPEQAQGREVDHRSDLFSLGVVLYEVIAGKAPFRRSNDAATLQAIVSDAPEPLARYKNDIPAELERIVSKALAKNPAERYQSAADFAADLRTMGRLIDADSSGSSRVIAASHPSVAVLPFANMSADPENEYFSDGLTEEVLNVLAKNPGLKVTGRTSSFAFKGKQEDLREIGHKLGVETLLEGSVRKAGNRVRITAQLVKVSDGFHIWSETYDRVLDDIFAVQDNIAKEVSKAMNVTLIGVNETARRVDPESYALTLRGRHYSQQMTKESLATAIDIFKSALELDPDNVQAWAALSIVYATRVAYGHAENKDEQPLAREAAERALALDENSAEAHTAMCWVYTALEMKLKEGIPHIRRAYELAPNNSMVVNGMATWEMILGNFDRAIAHAAKAAELDPLDPFAFREYGRILLFAGKIDDAIKMYRKALDMSPNMTSVRYGICMCYVQQGKHQEALDVVADEKLSGYRLCGQSLALYGLGRYSEADKHLEELLKESDHWAAQFATVYAYRKEIDRAFYWLEKGYEIRDAGIPIVKAHPFYRSLHSDPRWPAFLEKIGLAD